MKTWTVKTERSEIEITAYSVTTDMVADNVVWADGIRIAFDCTVYYVEEL